VISETEFSQAGWARIMTLASVISRERSRHESADALEVLLVVFAMGAHEILLLASRFPLQEEQVDDADRHHRQHRHGEHAGDHQQ
jgi:hypothetical protein